MEEKETKTVEMKAVEGNKEEAQKLTYEQLNEACNQLFHQNQQLRGKLNEINTFNAFKRLDYLFKVVEFADTIKDAEFINSCIEEIKEAMVTKDEEPQEDNKE